MTNRKWIFCQVESKNKDQPTKLYICILSLQCDVPHKKLKSVLTLFMAAYVKFSFLPTFLFNIEISE